MSSALSRAVLLAIGDELVSGLTVDSNSAYIAQALRGAGIDVLRVACVPDDRDQILTALSAASADAPLVITTGGLGPTADDLTTACVAEFAGVDLDLDPDSLRMIEERFRERGIEMPPNNRKQALLPRGCTLLPNPIGTAPAFLLPLGAPGRSGWLASLPGVPREMREICDSVLIPELSGLAGGRHLASRIFSTVGLSESALDDRLSKLKTTADSRISFRAAFPRLQVRVSVDAGSEAEATNRIRALSSIVEQKLGKHIYAIGDVGLEEVVGDLLRERSHIVAVAESCTGGLIGHRLTQVAGSSAYFAGGVIAYSNDLKVRLLGVSETTLARTGAVSEETVAEMAEGIRVLTGSTIGLATSGIAGPGGGTDEKPVGTVAIGIAGPAGSWTHLFRFPARSREWIKDLTAQTALDRLRLYLMGELFGGEGRD